MQCIFCTYDLTFLPGTQTHNRTPQRNFDRQDRRRPCGHYTVASAVLPDVWHLVKLCAGFSSDCKADARPMPIRTPTRRVSSLAHRPFATEDRQPHIRRRLRCLSTPSFLAVVSLGRQGIPRGRGCSSREGSLCLGVYEGKMKGKERERKARGQGQETDRFCHVLKFQSLQPRLNTGNGSVAKLSRTRSVEMVGKVIMASRSRGEAVVPEHREAPGPSTAKFDSARPRIPGAGGIRDVRLLQSAATPGARLIARAIRITYTMKTNSMIPPPG